MALIGHNPAITNIANQFAGDLTDNVPTSGQVCIDFSIRSWTGICSPKAALRFFDYPKRHPELQSKPS